MSCRRYVDRVALVTGAGNGIGKATSLRLAEEGATVVMVDRDEPALDAASGEVAGSVAHAMDVSVEADWERVVAAVREQFGRVDVFVNNAGFSHVARVTDYSVDEWRTLHETDLMGMFLGLKHTIPLLRESPAPAIVNMGSIMGLSAFPGIPAYSAAKGGVIALSRQVALDYAADGIRVNCVCPGPVKTERLAAIAASGAIDESKLVGEVLLGRWAKPSEIASVIAFLGSDDASFITGTEIVVDGGRIAH